MPFRVVLTFLAACLASGPVAAAHAQTQRDIPYVTDSRGTQLADLYEPPQGAGPFPAIVYIHGGSWRSGNKKDFARFAGDLAIAGYVGFSIKYDLHRKSFPISWQEARAAVRFLRLHATEYRIDPDRIAVAGTSAGGEIAALLAVAPNGPSMPVPGPELERPGIVPVAAAISLNGGYDLSPGSHFVINRYLGGKCSVLKAACADASPLTHVQPGEPPFFIGHGDHDHLITVYQAEDFTAALRRAGDPVTLYIAAHGGHMYWRKKRYYDANLRAVEQFLATALPSSTR